MTDRELAQQTWTELTKTTDPYPTWVRKGRPETSHWAKAKKLLDQIGGKGAQPPQGPFVENTTAQWYRSTPTTIEGVHVHDAPDYGVAVMGYFSPAPPAPAPSAFVVHDCIGENIGATPPSMDGRGEAGLWFGSEISANRVRGDGTWMGCWTGAQCRDSTINNLTCAKADGTRLPHIGLYIEHSTRRLIIDGLTIRSASNGVNVEWWYQDPNYYSWLVQEYTGIPYGKAGSLDIEIRNFDIDTGAWAFYLDAGSCGFNLHDGVIRGYNGIAHPASLALTAKPNRIDWSTIDFYGTGQKELIHTNPIG